MKKYKETHQHQYQLLPPSLDELIEENHLVRVIDEFVSGLSPLVWDHTFKGGGAPSYHPQMMLKIILAAYSSKIFSSRQIARLVRQDVTFMWLAGMQRPSFNTINRFRSDYFRGIFADIFTELLNYLHEQGYISFSDYFVDGTKIEANAGPYTHVWKKNTKRYKAAVQSRVKRLLIEIDALNLAEDQKYGEGDLPERGNGKEISSEEIRSIAEELNNKIENITEKKKKRKLKSKISRLKKEASKQAKYEQQEQNLGERNSYSKTDKDATFMRLKDNRLRPAYNAQLSSENQFIVNYSVSQNASDAITFPEHLKEIINRGDKYLPDKYVGDSAYGSEENYMLLEENNIDKYLKHNTFHSKSTNKFPYHQKNFLYDEKTDTFRCPAGQILEYVETVTKKSKTGHVSFIRIYECDSCSSCPNKSECTKAKGNRKIYYNPLLAKYKKEANNNLNSELGVELRKRRGPEIETFFGDLKHNNKFRRFSLRGLEKVTHELALLAISYNLRKIAADRAKKAISKALFIYEKTKNLLLKPIFSADLPNFAFYTNFST